MSDHHPVAEAIYTLLEESDWTLGGDYFCWKSGGEGDNGECLMAVLSEWIRQDSSRLKPLKQLLKGELT